MNLLGKFNQSFGFTKTESRVILFLVLAFISGIGIKIYKSNFESEKKFDYTALDSEFTARSLIAAESDSSKSDRMKNKDGSTRIKSNDLTIIPPYIIDLNKATKEELTGLPGIGDVIAERIINYKKENGPFTSVETLMKIKGIGKKKFEKVAPFITVGK